MTAAAGSGCAGSFCALGCSAIPSPPAGGRRRPEGRAREEAEKALSARCTARAGADAGGASAGAIPPLRWLLRHTTLIRLTARLSMGGEDAAEAALSAGRMQGVLHGLLALLRNAVRVPPRAEILLAIAPDYLSDSSEGEVRLAVEIRPALLLAAGSWAGIRILRTFASRQPAGATAHPADRRKKPNGHPRPAASGAAVDR